MMSKKAIDKKNPRPWIYGGSAGGYFTPWALLTAPEIYRAGKQFRMIVMPGQNHGLGMGFDVGKDGAISLRGSAGFLYEAVRKHFQDALGGR